MPPEPVVKRAIAFFDGQNLFWAAKEAFGHSYPSYDPLALAKAVCDRKGWTLSQVRFYTGVPDKSDNQFWNYFWMKKLASMGKRGIHTFSRSLRYRNQKIKCPTGTITVMVGQEKGVDVRLALDVVRSALRREYDVALIFSQDQDLSEVAQEIREIAGLQQRWIKIACAFPLSPTSRNIRGIDKTDWIIIDRKTYEACLDPNDYRPKIEEP
jgi:uncharacterized LabA/DUF88 family protein